MKKILLAAAAVLALSVGGIPPVQAQNAEETSFTRQEIENIVREYLLANPQILYEVQAEYEKQQRQAQREASRQVIAQEAERIFNSSHDGVLGNPDGDITVVEFFDYNCGYCKRALGDLDTLVKDDGDLRFVLKEFPVLGNDSRDAHVVSMAFRSLMPEKYDAFHRRLLSGSGRANEESAIKIALELGADETELRAAMEKPEIMEAFRDTYALADQLQITGTPSYVVGDEVVFGAVGSEQIREHIETARQ
ncbi:DsbA family protein [Chelativorans sp. M5D2P16]|uniref:DsbA family protein n=1 Tax=Chelativorans sp. M5D2P16 TaxID=3095678 RepID=UPI002ACAAE4A|nr:DsbA family protein [Chelativorans sp. M5D2P16]MDZ5697669.1 DsbA family protein [Chelativorans sp. M5D2P16]